MGNSNLRNLCMTAAIGGLVMSVNAQNDTDVAAGVTLRTPARIQQEVADRGYFGGDAAGEAFWSSARDLVGNHDIWSFDSTGELIGSVDQVPTAWGSGWGYRDGAADRSGGMYFGWETGLAWHANDGSGGVEVVAGGAPGGVGTWRALAYDPTGDGGAGSIWTQSFSTGVAEVNLSGGLLKSFGNPGTSAYGFAFDPTDGNLWVHTTGGAVVKMDTTTGLLTGAGWANGFFNLASQGGLSGVHDGSGDVYAVSQGTPDEAGVYDTGGSLVGGPWDMEGQTGSNGHLGIAAVMAGGGAGSIIGVSWAGDAYKIDPTTGTGSLLGPTGFRGFNSMAKNSGGTLFAAADSDLFVIDPSTGVGTLIMPIRPLSSVRAMAFDSSDTLYAYEGQAGIGPEKLYSVNIVTGFIKGIGLASHNAIQGMAFDSSTGIMYAWDVELAGLLTVNLATGETTEVNPDSGTTGEIQTLAFKADGTLLAGGDKLYRINLTTGLWMLIGSGGYTGLVGMEMADGAGLRMTSSGVCPGTGTFNIHGAIPGGTLKFAYSLKPGPFTVPIGPCAGLVLDLGLPMLPGSPKTLSADAGGNASVSGFVPASVCGKVRIQTVEIMTCSKTNLVIYP